MNNKAQPSKAYNNTKYVAQIYSRKNKNDNRRDKKEKQQVLRDNNKQELCCNKKQQLKGNKKTRIKIWSISLKWRYSIQMAQNETTERMKTMERLFERSGNA